MNCFGDGREERMAALTEELRLRSNPEVIKRKFAYEARVDAARTEARGLGTAEVINRLIAHNPAYIRGLLETEDARFGEGALFERYARTFYKTMPLT